MAEAIPIGSISVWSATKARPIGHVGLVYRTRRAIIAGGQTVWMRKPISGNVCYLRRFG